jgi:hypothetical protein
MHRSQVGILKKMGCYSVKMITGQNMENLARTVDRYVEEKILEAVH